MSSAVLTEEQHKISAPGDGKKLISPKELCHVVLKTTEEGYRPMVDFYLTFLGATLVHGTHRLSFLSYDHEHHRIAILIDPTCHRRQAGEEPQTGLHHMAFGLPRLSDLADSYLQKKALGIEPTWCVNHGMSTSMYYADPDGNGLELQVDNFDTKEEAIAFMDGEKFRENPVGVDYDPEVFVQRVRSGEDDKSIKARPNSGPRSKK